MCVQFFVVVRSTKFTYNERLRVATARFAQPGASKCMRIKIDKIQDCNNKILHSVSELRSLWCLVPDMKGGKVYEACALLFTFEDPVKKVE